MVEQFQFCKAQQNNDANVSQKTTLLSTVVNILYGQKILLHKNPTTSRRNFFQNYYVVEIWINLSNKKKNKHDKVVSLSQKGIDYHEAFSNLFAVSALGAREKGRVFLCETKNSPFEA